jgi:Tol biopolymer transport system component
MNSDGSDRRQILPPAGSKECPSFTPDGKQIVFLEDLDPGDLMGDIYVTRLDGSGLRKIASTR